MLWLIGNSLQNTEKDEFLIVVFFSLSMQSLAKLDFIWLFLRVKLITEISYRTLVWKEGVQIPLSSFANLECVDSRERVS